MKAVAAVAEILKREGVKFLIGYPVNSIIEAAAQADIRTIIVRQERTGLHMADAVSRVTSGKRIGVFTMQPGDALAVPFYGEHDLTAREAVQAFHFAGMILDALGHELTRPRQRADHKR